VRSARLNTEFTSTYKFGGEVIGQRGVGERAALFVGAASVFSAHIDAASTQPARVADENH
jgi:hypothetical protein